MQSPKIQYFSTCMAVLLLLIAGSCSKLCNSGYEGSRCNVLATTKFTGVWAAVDSPGGVTYLDTISQGAVFGDITLSASFAGHHFSQVINASVSEDILTIPFQKPDTSNNYVQGSGTINSDHNNISLSYQLFSGPDSARVSTNYRGSWTRVH